MEGLSEEKEKDKEKEKEQEPEDDADDDDGDDHPNSLILADSSDMFVMDQVWRRWKQYPFQILFVFFNHHCRIKSFKMSMLVNNNKCLTAFA